jgi:cupin-like protein
MPSPRIQFDPETFDPWKIQAVTHRLADHPLLQIDSLIELGKRQQVRKLVRTHNDAAEAGTSFAEAPKLHPNPKSAEETLANIAHAKAWMSLLNIQVDPIYRGFLDEVLDEIRPIVERRDPGMCYRAGWIFVSSPNAVTPFHIDHEHNFILHVRGTKRLHTWDPMDRSVVSERAQELFHSEHSREQVVWRDELLAKARIFDLEPGMGGYMPSTTPHVVKNGNDVSITISMTYYTDSTRRRELLYRANARLRKLGLDPRPVGTSPALDAVKHTVLRGYSAARETMKRALGKDVKSSAMPYAPA